MIAPTTIGKAGNAGNPYGNGFGNTLISNITSSGVHKAPSEEAQSVNLVIQTNRWVRGKDGKWVRGSIVSGQSASQAQEGVPGSQERMDHSIGSEYSAGRDYFNSSGIKPNMNLLEQFNRNLPDGPSKDQEINL